jgi:MFS family permease
MPKSRSVGLGARPTVTPDVIRLNVSSILASIPFGYMTIVLPIYFSKIGLDSVVIGQLFTISSVTSAVLLIVFGFLADRFGRKPFVLAGTLLPAVSYLVLLSTTDPLALSIAAALGGVGLANGLSGALASAGFNALLAEKTDDASRNFVFSLTNAGWTAALMAGSLIGGLPEWLQRSFGAGVAESYRPLFALSLVLVVLGAAALLPVKETHRRQPAHPVAPLRRPMSGATFSATLKLSLFMALIGLGLGFAVQMLPLWFYLKFGASGDALGPWYAAAELVSTVAVLGMPRLAQRWGAVKTVVALQGASAVALAAMVAAPVAWVAALLMVARTTLLNVSWPVQQSYMMGIVAPRERAAVSSTTYAAWGLASAFSPIVAGAWIDQGQLALPVLAGAACYAVSALVFLGFFRRTRPPEEALRPAAPA